MKERMGKVEVTYTPLANLTMDAGLERIIEKARKDVSDTSFVAHVRPEARPDFIRVYYKKYHRREKLPEEESDVFLNSKTPVPLLRVHVRKNGNEVRIHAPQFLSTHKSGIRYLWKYKGQE